MMDIGVDIGFELSTWSLQIFRKLHIPSIFFYSKKSKYRKQGFLYSASVLGTECTVRESQGRCETTLEKSASTNLGKIPFRYM